MIDREASVKKMRIMRAEAGGGSLETQLIEWFLAS